MHLDPIWFSIVVDFALYFDKILFTKLFKSYKTFLYFQGNESEISLKSYFSWKKLKVQITCLLFWTCVRWCYLRSSGHSAVALYWSILFLFFIFFILSLLSSCVLILIIILPFLTSIFTIFFIWVLCVSSAMSFHSYWIWNILTFLPNGGLVSYKYSAFCSVF